MRIIFTSLAFFLLTFQLLAQQREVSGTLTARDGSPLLGINIAIKGTGTTTVLKAEIPGTFTGAASAAYLYYTNEFKNQIAGNSIRINS